MSAGTKETKVPRFDKLWHDIIDLSAKLGPGRTAVQNAVKRFRRTAYRFTKAYLLIEKHYHNELLDQVKSAGKELAEWLDEVFSPIEALGETRQKLLAAVESGMSEGEYVGSAEVWLIRNQQKIRTKPEAAEAMPPDPPATMTTEEKVEYMADMIRSLKAQIQGLRQSNRQLSREKALLIKDNDHLRRQMTKVLSG
jgi:hypothetical protein